MDESKSLKGFNYDIWTGYFVRKDTPEAVVQRLHTAIGKTVVDPTVRSQLAAQTQLAAAPMSLADAAKFYAAETARYRAIAKKINLQPQ